ncbi:hypothetical protein [Humibacter sp. RRB41]|uniref:hypothetical protein n=1 Tax=Humibacter sp. RRB41 TaxID=2919946 RepID=UPI001FAB1D24|nr:hypothetical protein [Humibacter sp. RRB41]
MNTITNNVSSTPDDTWTIHDIALDAFERNLSVPDLILQTIKPGDAAEAAIRECGSDLSQATVIEVDDFAEDHGLDFKATALAWGRIYHH